MASEVGSIYVSVMPTTAGLTRQMNSEISGAFVTAGRTGESVLRGLFTRIAAFGATVLATVGLGRLIKDTVQLGIEYNTLQQTSRAAFTTILGSSEAATQMLADIKEFSLLTPFPRQAYIKAAQQMTAFGIESKKVIPYLDGITDAVAAAGGNSQTLSEITFVMAQIAAAGKITGIDLIQFGQRGINAATLIGSQMGKTGAEIREMITAGALDATVALDALAAAMKSTYNGAAANVKNTWLGAVDRVKGATRDLAGALLEPFIDPNGGGYFVKWANDFADSLRSVEQSPAIGSLQSKLAGLGAALDPFFTRMSEIFALLREENGIQKFTDAISSAFPVLGLLSTIASSLAPVAPVLGEAFLELGKALTSEGVLDAITQLVVEVLPPLVDLLVAITPLIPPLAQFLTAILVPALMLVTGNVGMVTDTLEAMFTTAPSFLEWASKLANSGNTIVLAAFGMANALAGIANGFIDAVNGIVGGVETLVNAIAALSGATVTLPRLTRLGSITPTVITRGFTGLADSGTILPRPGGTLILAAEAGRAESVVDTGKLNDLMAAASNGGGGIRDINFNGIDPAVVWEMAKQELRGMAVL